MAASVVVAVPVVAAAVARLAVVPAAPVVVVPAAPVVVVLAAPEALGPPEAEAADRVLPVSGVPVAVGEVRRGSAAAPTSVRTRSTSACWTAAFRSRTLVGCPSF